MMKRAGPARFCLDAMFMLSKIAIMVVSSRVACIGSSRLMFDDVRSSRIGSVRLVFGSFRVA